MRNIEMKFKFGAISKKEKLSINYYSLVDVG